MPSKQKNITQQSFKLPNFGKEKQTEMVRHIYLSAQGMANVVEDFLNVTKIEQGGMKYIFAPVDIRTIVNDLVSDMKISAEDKHLEFLSEIDTQETFMVNADGTKIKQVFLNLVDNSIKYTKEGFVKVSLKKQKIESGQDCILFLVSDSGIGITEEVKSKLFQKFNRGNGAALNTGGSGLGLYLAQEIIKAHKGEILIESEGLGKGSTFSVILPIL
jgi:signal transduction histidine kinase